MRAIMDIGNFALWAATVPEVLFVILYSRVSWWRTHIGRQVMAQATAMALILLVSGANTIFGRYPGRPIIRVVVFVLIVPTIWWRLYLLVVTQWHMRYNEEPNERVVREGGE